MANYNQKYPSKILENAVQAISSLPGVGSRSALRLALFLLRQPTENVKHFTQSINALREDIKYCKTCMMVCDEDVCPICANTKRDHNQICVVESIRDVMSIENTDQFKGVYHVLGGIISPLNGIGPTDLTIDKLVQRVATIAQPNEAEIILALSGDVEGETTSFYIYRQLEKYGIKISSLARGLGFGDDLEYADELTLGRSIINRQIFKP